MNLVNIFGYVVDRNNNELTPDEIADIFENITKETGIIFDVQIETDYSRRVSATNTYIE